MIETKPFPSSILITDDHSVIRKTLREWLSEEFPELIILEASSGEDALEIISDGTQPDLIVLDFHLPGISGIEVTRKIKGQYPHLPVLMLTIQEDQVYIDRALEAGADSYVIKRQMYSELIPTIQRIYNGSTEQA
jgi:DNA-binding NarL/FixJ family response regulator